MTRPIKFRAWHKTVGKTVDVFAVNPMNQTVMLSHQQLIGHDAPDVLESYREDGEVVLMQSTGLTDKNGKEIYEGDIVKRVFRLTNKKVANQNETRDHGTFVAELCTKLHTKPSHIVVGNQVSGKSTTTMRNEYEMIGNIHENPELK